MLFKQNSDPLITKEYIHQKQVIFIKQNRPYNIKEYKTYKNYLTSLLRKAERKHYTQQLELNKNDLNKTWRVMKNMIGLKNRNDKKIVLQKNSHDYRQN